jgi:hypothetical protein
VRTAAIRQANARCRDCWRGYSGRFVLQERLEAEITTETFPSRQVILLGWATPILVLIDVRELPEPPTTAVS